MGTAGFLTVLVEPLKNKICAVYSLRRAAAAEYRAGFRENPERRYFGGLYGGF